MSSIQTFDFGMFRQIDGNPDGFLKELPCHVLQSTQVTLPNPLQDEAIWSDELQVFFRIVSTLQAQRLDPGVELLRREFLLELLETG
ncbi:MAG: hypothetical protein HKUEN07_09750 [Rhodocyclaceae bacterium]|nr:MAG: hypothetical protein HKUEN07_09750 [Rhodocyclaceae bacterium]